MFMTAGINKKKQRGFSLIELNCALFIIIFGLFGMMQIYLVSIDKMRVNQEEILALRVLENELEGLRAMPFDALVVGEGRAFEQEIPAAYALVKATGSTRITIYPEGGGRLKEVTVLLRWVGDNGRIRHKALTSLLADREVLP